MVRSAGHVRPLSALTLALGAAALALGCDFGSSGPQLGHAQVVVGAGDSLQVLSRSRDGEDEGGGYSYHEFLYAARDGSGWKRSSSAVGSGDPGSSFETPYRLLVDSKGRTFLVGEIDTGLVALVLQGSEWQK